MVNHNTAILVILAVLFIGFGSLQWMFYTGIDGMIEACPRADGQVEGWGETDCTTFWHQFDIAEFNARQSEALLCYTVAVLLIASGFIYRRQALARE